MSVDISAIAAGSATLRRDQGNKTSEERADLLQLADGSHTTLELVSPTIADG
jgi:hypothetical protein